MKRLNKNIFDKPVATVLLFVVAFVGFYLCLRIILSDSDFVNVNNNFVKPIVSKYFFLVGIIGSMIYSNLIMQNDFIYDLTFGKTRLSFYKDYLKRIFLFFSLIIFLALFYFVILLINKNIVFNELINMMKIDFVSSFIALFIFGNALMILFSTRFKQKENRDLMRLIIPLSITLVIIFFRVFLVMSFLNGLIIDFVIFVLAVLLSVLNYYLIKKQNV